MKNIYNKKIKTFDWQKNIIDDIINNIKEKNKNKFLIQSPTGSGKTIIVYEIINKLKKDASFKNIIFTAPIKALSNERYKELSKIYGKENVGIITGDYSKNSNARILCMTQEIYSAFKDEKNIVIVDEIHYMFSNPTRSTAYIKPLVKTNPKSILIALSATINKKQKEYIKRIVGEDVVIYNNTKTLTDKEYIMDGIGIKDLKKYTPALIFAFSNREINSIIQYISMNTDFEASAEEKVIIHELAAKYKIENKQYIKLAMYGFGKYIGYMLLKERLFTEELMRRGIIKILVGTDGLALGVNLPVKAVLFGTFEKMFELLKKSEFEQMSGRSGRYGLFNVGYISYLKEFADGSDFEYLVEKDIDDDPIELNYSISHSEAIKNNYRLDEDLEIIRRIEPENESKEISNFEHLRYTVAEMYNKYGQKFVDILFDITSDDLEFEKILNITMKIYKYGKIYLEDIIYTNPEYYDGKMMNNLLQILKVLKKMPHKYLEKNLIQKIENFIYNIDENYIKI